MNRALVVLGLLLSTTPVAYGHPKGAGTPDSSPPKKDRERAKKTPNTARIVAPGTKPAKLVNLYNTWTDEWLALAPGEKPSLEITARFLRDHYTNKPTKMEPRLLQIVTAAAKHFGSDQAMVVSAFRHPKYNLILRKKGRQVARDSQHTHGTAIDFFIPRVATLTLHAWAKAQAIGGVGLYLESGFVHMDTGKVRYWNGE
ncbi:MAG: YcbK family protein [Kofleriaceae bacterium]